MNCPNEFIQSQFVDGELPEQETEELVAHLHFCSVCREGVAALKTEKQLIVQSLQGVGAWAPEREFPEIKKIALFAAIAGCVTVLLRMFLDLILETTAPAELDWVFPLSLSGLLSWLGNGIFYFIENGAPMIASFIEKAAVTVIGLIIIGVMISMVRKMKTITSIIGVTAIMFAFVMPGYSIDYRKAEKMGGILVPAEETVDDTLVAYGDTVKIRGTITGDLVAIARKVDIQGTVQGNVICIAQTFDSTGQIEGDLFTIGQFVQTHGFIRGSLWGAATNLTVGSNGKINYDAILMASDMNVDGEVGRDLSAAGGFLDIGGAIGRNVIFSGARILIQAPVKIGRNLHAKVTNEKQSKVDAKATIAGEKKIELVKTKSKYLNLRFYLGWMFYVIVAFLLGLLLFGIMPKAGRFSFSTGRTLAASGGIGILIFIVLPVVALILAIPLFSLPIGLVIFALWFLGLFLAPVIVANYIGRAILRREDEKISTRALALIIGLGIVVVAVNLPYVGAALNFLLILMGLGALAITGQQTWALRRSAEGSAL